MNEADLRKAIAAKLRERQVAKYKVAPAGGATVPEMTLVATVGVLHVWGIRASTDDVIASIAEEAIDVAIDGLLPRIPQEDEERLHASEHPDRPSLGGPGVVG